RTTRRAETARRARGTRRARSDLRATRMTRRPGARRALAAVILAIGTSVGGQVPTDTSAHHFHVDASALRPGQFLYRTTLERDTAILSVSTRAVLVSEANYAGTPTWLVVERREGTGILVADT